MKSVTKYILISIDPMVLERAQEEGQVQAGGVTDNPDEASGIERQRGAPGGPPLRARALRAWRPPIGHPCKLDN